MWNVMWTACEMGNEWNLPVDMYQPLKAQPGKTKPPQSKSMLETAK